MQRELADAPPRKPSPPHTSISLRAHQQEAARAIGAALAAGLPSFLLADDVGLGKTVEAGLVLREMLLRKRVDFAAGRPHRWTVFAARPRLRALSR